MIIIYQILFFLVNVLILPVSVPFLILVKKRRKTWWKRFAPDVPVTLSPGKQPIWVHALSVGEVLSAIPLVKEISKQTPATPIVFSASTYTGFQTAGDNLSERIEHIFYFPFDFPFSVKRAFDLVDPKLLIIVETDIWPGFLSEAKRRNTPIVLVNARLSETSFRGYRKIRFLMEPALNTFWRICVQSPLDADRFRALGGKRIDITGNIKFDQPVPDLSEKDLCSMRSLLRAEKTDTIIIAGSTHKGEEDLMAKGFSEIYREHPKTILVIAPRNPERSAAILPMFQSAGFHAALYSRMTTTSPKKKPNVIIIDKIGLLRTLYAISDIAVIGGSFFNHGGHNPLEPAMFGKPVVFGPYMSDFAWIAERLVLSGAALGAENQETLFSVLSRLLSDKSFARQTGNHALRVFLENRGALDRVMETITKYSQP